MQNVLQLKKKSTELTSKAAGPGGGQEWLVQTSLKAEKGNSKHRGKRGGGWEFVELYVWGKQRIKTRGRGWGKEATTAATRIHVERPLSFTLPNRRVKTAEVHAMMSTSSHPHASSPRSTPPAVR
jgi:hypothetical protein